VKQGFQPDAQQEGNAPSWELEANKLLGL
jgi:hypothetical protein